MAERSEIAQWSQQTAYRKSPSLTPTTSPSPKMGSHMHPMNVFVNVIEDIDKAFVLCRMSLLAKRCCLLPNYFSTCCRQSLNDLNTNFYDFLLSLHHLLHVYCSIISVWTGRWCVVLNCLCSLCTSQWSYVAWIYGILMNCSLCFFYFLLSFGLLLELKS